MLAKLGVSPLPTTSHHQAVFHLYGSQTMDSKPHQPPEAFLGSPQLDPPGPHGVGPLLPSSLPLQHGTSVTRSLVPTTASSSTPWLLTAPRGHASCRRYCGSDSQARSKSTRTCPPRSHRRKWLLPWQIVTFTVPATLCPLGVSPPQPAGALTKRTVLIPILLGLVTSTCPAGMGC